MLYLFLLNRVPNVNFATLLTSFLRNTNNESFFQYMGVGVGGREEN